MKNKGNVLENKGEVLKNKGNVLKNNKGHQRLGSFRQQGQCGDYGEKSWASEAGKL